MIVLGWKLGKWGRLSMGITAVEANRGGLLAGGYEERGLPTRNHTLSRILSNTGLEARKGMQSLIPLCYPRLPLCS